MKEISDFYSLVMAGGAGTRFWPESRKDYPKQYLHFFNNKSLFQQTLERFDQLISIKNRFCVTVRDQEVLANEQSGGALQSNHLIFEPMARNTAPCVYLSIMSLIHRYKVPLDSVVAILPSDHVILDVGGFQNTLTLAYEYVKKNKVLATIGIKPFIPHTGFGYIKKGIEKSAHFFSVDSFKEKPNLEVATQYMASGSYLWNAGIFLGRLDTWIHQFGEHSPEITKTNNEFGKLLASGKDFSEIYQQMPSISIDYALMEKTKEIVVIPAQFDWNDLGSWDAIESICPMKDQNFTLSESTKVYFNQSKGNIIQAPNKFVALIGVDNLIIVENEKSLMILPKNKSQEVKEIVNYLKTQSFGNDLL